MLAIMNRVGWLAVLVIGTVQFGLFFTDLSPRESITMRGLEFAFVSLVGGATIGFVVPRSWFLLCVAASWGALVAGLIMHFMYETRLGVLIAATSLGTLIAGGTIGALLRKFKASREVRRLSSR